MAVAATLRNCARALRRLDTWVSEHYTTLHNFSIPVSVLMHFLSVSVIGLVDEDHVPRNLTDGLIFGAGHLSLDIPIKHAVVVAFCKVNHNFPCAHVWGHRGICAGQVNTPSRHAYTHVLRARV